MSDATSAPEHREGGIVDVMRTTIGDHKWQQRGVEMVCDGNNHHFSHAFRVPPELIYRKTTENGDLVFDNVKTKKKEVWSAKK